MMVVAFPQPTTSSTNLRNQQEQAVNQQENVTRPPLSHSTRENGGETSHSNSQRRPRGRQVPSRYMSPSPSISSSPNVTTSGSTSTVSVKRYPSPLLSRSTNSNLTTTTTTSTTTTGTTPSLLLKRSQSVDRRRPVANRSVTPVPGSNTSEMSAATKMLITSTRSLSVSFQGESFSLPISKKKESINPNLNRKSTPDRRRATPVRDHGENSRPVDQQRWPARTRQGNPGSNPLCRSLDCVDEKRKLVGFGSGAVVKSLHQSMLDESRRVSLDERLNLDLGNAEELLSIKEPKRNPDVNSGNELASSASCDLTASDTDSVSSGSTNGAQECGGLSRGKSLPRGIVMSPRFWQETNSRLRRLQDPGSPLSSPGSKPGASPKFIQSKRFSNDGSLASPRAMSSPNRVATRPASPSKLWGSTTSSPSRAIASPSRVRNALTGQVSSNYGSSPSPSILSFSVDVRRGKIGEDRFVDAHMLRLLYNRYLQWRFVNARADATFVMQRLNAENNLWNAWVTISELRHSVTLRKIKLLLLRQKLKLTSILKGQVAYLDEWGLLDRDHSSSLLGATEALKASTLRLPIVGKAIADIQNLKDAIGSAVDVMQAMAFSICPLSSKVEEMNSLIAELVNITGKERIFLDQSKDFLSKLAAMQVKDCSLRTHIIQLSRCRRVPASLNRTQSCRN